MSESIDLINGDEQISLAIVRDIIVVIIYLFLKYIIINL